MKITVATLFPELFEPFFMTSIMKKAQLQEFVTFQTVDIRKYTTDKHNRVDDSPFGGGAGLVMKVQPIVDMLQDIKTPNSKVIYLTPVAPLFTQTKAKELSYEQDIILLCGHYEGVDERVLHYCDEVLSIGDYILTGGEVAAMVVVEAVVRLIDGVISSDSTLEESFESNLLEYPQYTRPASYNGMDVPDVLLSGHHLNVQVWREKESLKRTLHYRPDLLKKAKLSSKQQQVLAQIKAENEEEN
jgi:tRNA (guanine37-N1)-methyltransferase